MKKKTEFLKRVAVTVLEDLWTLE